jgi:hypothetical protein
VPTFWDRQWDFTDDDTEANVSQKFAMPFVTALGWPENHGDFEYYTPSGDGRADLLITKPGPRRRPGSDRRTIPRGDVYAVIEFKRPTEAVDAPETWTQVEKYANEFDASYYFVINGRELMCWEQEENRRTEIKRCSFADLATNRHFLLQRLGWDNLSRYHHSRRDSINSRNVLLRAQAANASLLAAWGRLRFTVRDESELHLEGALPAEDAPEDWLLWGAPNRSADAVPARVYLDSPEAGDRSPISRLHAAVARIGLHGGIQCLYLQNDQVGRCGDRVRAALDCLGTADSDEFLPRAGPLAAARWTVQPLERWAMEEESEAPAGVDVDVANTAEHLQKVMDSWVWKRLRNDIEIALGVSAVASLARLGFDTHKEVRDQLVPRWERVRAALEGDGAARLQFLLGALTPAHERDQDRARLRLGPRTTQILLRAVFFQLLVGEALAKPCLPHRATGRIELYENLDLEGDTVSVGHLLAITHTSGREVLSELVKKPSNEIRFPLLLPGCRQDAPHVAKRLNLHSLVSGTRVPGRLGTAHGWNPLVLPLTDDLQTCLAAGWDAARVEVRRIVEEFADADADHRRNLRQPA